MRSASGLAEADLTELELSVEDGVSQGREAIRDLVERGVQFDAIVCASDSLGLGAMLMVGADVPVIGYDNTPVADAVGLSSVEQPLDEVARGVLELIGTDTTPETPAGGADPWHRLVTPTLVLRHRRIGSRGF
jgi:DNA-binding LacI/PurR family transcriptional regulator